MRVDIYGTYRLVTGIKSIEISLPEGSRLIDGLNQIATDYPTLRKELFDEQGRPYSDIPIFLDGRNPRLLEAEFETIVKPQQVLSIFSPIASGRLNVEDVNQILSSTVGGERV